jgi:hypothetical protein
MMLFDTLCDTLATCWGGKVRIVINRNGFTRAQALGRSAQRKERTIEEQYPVCELETVSYS